MITSIGFIGYGNMGSALAQGLHAASPQTTIIVAEPDPAKAALARNEVKAETDLDSAEFCAKSQIILVAVKPQLLSKVLPAYAPYTSGKNIISIAAGTRISYFKETLKTDQVIRFMPNIAARVGKALTAVSCAEEIDQTFHDQALELAEAAGGAIELAESTISAFTGLCGSGIAYVFQFLHAMALGGTKEGIPYDQSLAIAIATMEGATALVQESGENPITLLSRVISPAGTTIQGVDALERGSFNATVINAIELAARRARELE